MRVDKEGRGNKGVKRGGFGGEEGGRLGGWGRFTEGSDWLAGDCRDVVMNCKGAISSKLGGKEQV